MPLHAETRDGYERVSKKDLPKNRIIFALKDVSVYFRRTFMAGFGSLVCIYGGGFIYSLDWLPEDSKNIPPLPFLLKYRYLLSYSFGLFGIAAFCTNKYFIWRTISMVELRAGGKDVAFKALNRIPLSQTQYTFQTPLSHISCIQSRREAKSAFVKIKIRGKMGSYYIDKEGYFPDPVLFDNSIGVARRI